MDTDEIGWKYEWYPQQTIYLPARKRVSRGSRSQARRVEPHKPAFDTGSTFIFLVILTEEIKLFNDDT